MSLLASIPSPGSNAIHLGPLQLRAYGLMIALGVLAGVKLTQSRFVRLRVGTPDDVVHIATWGVPAGIIGARLYHVITDFSKFSGDPIRVFKIWEGGLGIPGGIALGVAVGAWRGKVRTGSIGPVLTAFTPAFPLAQGIGRLGNWFNQELFGRPTTLPWALKIDLVNRPAIYRQFSTFHPTFLYELLWDVSLCVVLIRIGIRLRLRPGRLFPIYIALYAFGRFFIERMRIDEATLIGGLRVNEWVMMALFLGSIAYLVIDEMVSRRRSAIVEPQAWPTTTESEGLDDYSDPSRGEPV